MPDLDPVVAAGASSDQRTGRKRSRGTGGSSASAPPHDSNDPVQITGLPSLVPITELHRLVAVVCMASRCAVQPVFHAWPHGWMVLAQAMEHKHMSTTDPPSSIKTHAFLAPSDQLADRLFAPSLRALLRCPEVFCSQNYAFMPPQPVGPLGSLCSVGACISLPF